MSHAKYSRFVRFIKRFLWGLVVAVVALVVWIASDSSGVSKARVVFSNMAGGAVSQVMQNIMKNPEYQGVDAQNRPYSVAATQATQLDKETVELHNIRADIALQNNAWVALNAGSGTLNLTTKQMRLTGGVDVFYTGGYEFRTPEVHIDIQQGSAYGEEPVEGQGPLGTIKAKGFALLDHGKTIFFNQSVTMKLYR